MMPYQIESYDDTLENTEHLIGLSREGLRICGRTTDRSCAGTRSTV